MGGNKQKKGFSVFNMLKFRKSKPSRDEYAREENTGSGRRVWPSDEDKGSWVAEPGIDRKAQDFIAKFHAIRYSESELHAVYQPGVATGKA
ncbi:uncharacterized protein LOC123205211 [Mangifera indica]|uniref:uncharacterized protein LOC123205211 n=1 Tax=Mangifera indica TaxID=29780 RepID=UPI001CFB1490|nr:uncharacterized protein LOC123205211 [Mangifera indica]